MASKRVILYARLSVTTEESVSIERQLHAMTRLAEARDWSIVGQHVDDGVSASKVRPEERPGWRAVLDYQGPLDAVVVWKIDRLARRVLDFLHADEALQRRGAGIVAVEDPVDMTTPQGRAFATMLAVFGEMEAAAISSRVKAARKTLLQLGRRAGGKPPYGWMNTPNPDGPGMVLVRDPDRIGYVVTLAEKAMAGASVYSLTKWLETEGVSPRPRRAPGSAASSKPVSARWHPASVEVILRNPVLAGMTPYTPGRKPLTRDVREHAKGAALESLKRVDVVRDRDGLPVIDESVAIMSPEEHRRLVAVLDAAKKPGTRPRSSQEPSLLGVLPRCGTCESLLHRSTVAGKFRYLRCANAQCERQVGCSRDALERFVVAEFLRVKGDELKLVFTLEAKDESVRLGELEHAIAETTSAMQDDDADMPALSLRLQNLKEARVSARAESGHTRMPAYSIDASQTYKKAYFSAETIQEKRDLLMSEIKAVKIGPGGKRGNRFDESRATILWGRPVEAIKGIPLRA
jgi:site-specific DNA recombinase